MLFTNAIPFDHQNGKPIFKKPFVQPEIKPAMQSSRRWITSLLLPKLRACLVCYWEYSLTPPQLSISAKTKPHLPRVVPVAFDLLNVCLQNVSHNLGAMLRMRRTEGSSHSSWIKFIMLYTWRSLAVLSASPSVAVSVMHRVKSRLMFLSLSRVLQHHYLWWWENSIYVLFRFIQVLYCISRPVLWLVKPRGLWSSDPRDAVSILCHISWDLLQMCFYLLQGL